MEYREAEERDTECVCPECGCPIEVGQDIVVTAPAQDYNSVYHDGCWSEFGEQISSYEHEAETS